MSDNHQRRKNYRFSLIVLTLVYCVFVLAFEKYHSYQGNSQIEEHAQIIADDLWNFNGQGISEYLELAASSGHYESLAVVSHNGEVFREVKSAAFPPAVSLGIRLHLIPRVVLISPIEYEQKYIGWLEGVWIPQTLSTHFTVFCFLTVIFLAILLYQRTINEKVILEKRVGERTQDLLMSFKKLTKEIEERKSVEKVLRQYEYIISSTDDMMSFVDNKYIYRAVNAAYLTAYNKKIDDIVGISVAQLMGKEAFSEVKKQLDQALSGKPVKFQAWLNYPVIGRQFMDITYNPFRNDAGEIEGVVVTAHDLTHRRRAEEALSQSEEKFRDLVENINDVIFSIDNSGVLTYISPLFFQWTGFGEDEVVGKKLTDFISTKDIDDIHDWFHGSTEEISRVREFRIHTKSDGFRWVQLSCRPKKEGGSIRGLRGVLTNISDKKNLEVQLFQAQKMEAVGTLAGGIAHDFNNLLTGIQGYASLLQTEFTGNDLSEKYLTNIESFVTSGVALTKQLLGFARGGKYEVRPTNLNDLLLQSSEIFGRTRKNINILKNLAEELWVVDVDRQQIEQVFLNLYLNAWQAMPDGGNLIVQTENYIHRENQPSDIPITSGEYATITVKDFGIGMDQEIMQRIFDPFFTTKEVGRGTGLGLASSYGIIKNHNGFITVSSEKGKGTAFTIYLPASHNNVAEVFDEKVGLKQGRETLLLVDDEKMILEVTGKMLRSLGYTVITATNGEDALKCIAEQPDGVDLLILDMVMPGMSGGDVFEEVRKISPKIKVLLSSGYSLDGQAQSIIEKGCNAFIQKPFSLMEISGKIRVVLDEKING